MKIAFVDVETTGTDPRHHEVWEIGIILRETETDTARRDTEYLWHLRPHLTLADPAALRIGRYYERSEVVTCEPETAVTLHGPMASPGTVIPSRQVARDLALMLDGAIIAAANVAFDAGFLTTLLRRYQQLPTWDYHLLEMESYAAGALGIPLPWKLPALLDAARITIPERNRHTALGDARAIRDLYDRITTIKGK